MSDNHYYGCCACIGSAGIGLVPKLQLLTAETGFVMNLFVNGTVESKTQSGKKIVFDTQTEYPKDGTVAITIHTEHEEVFELLIRNPYWSKRTKLSVNGESVAVNEGYICVNRTWKDGDWIEISLDIRTEAIYPIPYGEQILVVEVQIPLTDRSYINVTDYASAGKLWTEESKIAVWMLTD